MTLGTLKFPFEAPKRAKISDFCKQLALYIGIECKIESSKGWFTESGVVVCTGEYAKLFKFKEELLKAAEKYNK